MDHRVKVLMDQIEAALREACQHTLDEPLHYIVMDRYVSVPHTPEHIDLNRVMSNTSNSPCTSTGRLPVFETGS